MDISVARLVIRANSIFQLFDILDRYPWGAQGTDTVDVLVMLLRVVEALATIGFDIQASVKVTNPKDNDTQFPYVLY